MQVIDILNKIINKQELPKNIKIKQDYYHLNYVHQNANFIYEDDLGDFWLDNSMLIDEVEIIEDTDKLKKIDKLSYQQIGSWNLEQHNYIAYARAVDKQISQIGNKINELVKIANYLIEKDKEKN